MGGLGSGAGGPWEGRATLMYGWAGPFFWAFLSTVGWALEFLVIGSRTWGSNTFLGFWVVLLAEAPGLLLPLLTTGHYSIVRHPLYLCDVLWPLGLSLIFGSLIGIILVIAWFVLAYSLSWLEEERLLEIHGEDYRIYRETVPRLIPFLKWL